MLLQVLFSFSCFFLAQALLLKLSRLSRSAFINLPYFCPFGKSSFSFALSETQSIVFFTLSISLSIIRSYLLIIKTSLANCRTILSKYFSKKLLLNQNSIAMIYFMLNRFGNKASKLLRHFIQLQILISNRNSLITQCLSFST